MIYCSSNNFKNIDTLFIIRKSLVKYFGKQFIKYKVLFQNFAKKTKY